MNTFPDRDITTQGSRLVPRDFLQSIFVAELMQPSERLWISSPWISDIEIINNSARQFAAICPDWPATHIRLTAVLARLLERGAQVVIIVNESDHNDEFVRRLRPLQAAHGQRLRVIRAPDFHEKGILGSHFTMNGSMNLTYSGVYVNEEYLIYRTDPSKIAERRLALENRWGVEVDAPQSE